MAATTDELFCDPCIVMAYTVMAYTVMAYTVMADTVMAYTAHIVMGYIVRAAGKKGRRRGTAGWPLRRTSCSAIPDKDMCLDAGYIVMAYIVMVYIGNVI